MTKINPVLTMSSTEKFAVIFDGLQLAYGTFKIDKKQLNGKSTGRAAIVEGEPVHRAMGRSYQAKAVVSVSYHKRRKQMCLGVY